MPRYLRVVVWVLLPVTLLQLSTACASSRPRRRPVEGGAVTTGPGSLESVRRQLEGTWNLVSLERVSPTGQRVPTKATAVLTYDGYGNFSMKGVIDDPAAGSDQAAALNFTGRILIDTQQQMFRLLDLKQQDTDFKGLSPEAAAARTRFYAFEGDLLTMTVKTPSGQVVGVNTWRKGS